MAEASPLACWCRRTTGSRRWLTICGVPVGATVTEESAAGTGGGAWLDHRGCGHRSAALPRRARAARPPGATLGIARGGTAGGNNSGTSPSRCSATIIWAKVRGFCRRRLGRRDQRPAGEKPAERSRGSRLVVRAEGIARRVRLRPQRPRAASTSAATVPGGLFVARSRTKPPVAPGAEVAFPAVALPKPPGLGGATS